MSRGSLLRVSSQLFDRNACRLVFGAAYSHAPATTSQGVSADSVQFDSEDATRTTEANTFESAPARRSVRWYSTAKVRWTCGLLHLGLQLHKCTKQCIYPHQRIRSSTLAYITLAAVRLTLCSSEEVDSVTSWLALDQQGPLKVSRKSLTYN